MKQSYHKVLVLANCKLHSPADAFVDFVEKGNDFMDFVFLIPFFTVDFNERFFIWKQ